MLKFIEEKGEIKKEPNNSENKNTQVGKGLKALYIGQIEGENKQTKFAKLMDSLSKAYDSSEGDGKTCMIYNYYDEEKSVKETSANKHILTGIQPTKWAQVWAKEEKNTKACIEIIDHMLGLSGFKQYLDKEQNKIGLTTNHDICCCITYYHNRAGDVGFHQDSLGAELFVSLIYRDPVYGPELKLKEKDQFEQRLKDIEKMMPVCFITTLKDLYEKVQKENNDVVEINKKSLALNPDLIEWPGRLETSGCIVAWVDELMIHTTPYMHHRQPNGVLLIDILDQMQDKEFKWKEEAPEIKYIKLLENIIKEVEEENKERKHYITIHELKDKIKGNEESQEIEKVLVELYAVIEQLEFEGANENVDKVLSISNHQLYGEENNKEHSTGFSKRRASIEFDKKESLIGAEEGKQRSFLRVWVIALPK